MLIVSYLRNDKDPFLQIAALFVSFEVYVAVDCLHLLRLIFTRCNEVNIKDAFGLPLLGVANTFRYVYNSLLADTKCNLILQNPDSPSTSLLHNLKAELTTLKLIRQSFTSVKASSDAERVTKLEEQDFVAIIAQHKAEMKRLEGGKSRSNTQKNTIPKTEERAKSESTKERKWVFISFLNGTCNNNCGNAHKFPDSMKQSTRDELQKRANALLDTDDTTPNPRTQQVRQSC